MRRGATLLDCSEIAAAETRARWVPRLTEAQAVLLADGWRYPVPSAGVCTLGGAAPPQPSAAQVGTRPISATAAQAPDSDTCDSELDLLPTPRVSPSPPDEALPGAAPAAGEVTPAGDDVPAAPRERPRRSQGRLREAPRAAPPSSIENSETASETASSSMNTSDVVSSSSSLDARGRSRQKRPRQPPGAASKQRVTSSHQGTSDGAGPSVGGADGEAVASAAARVRGAGDSGNTAQSASEASGATDQARQQGAAAPPKQPAARKRQAGARAAEGSREKPKQSAKAPHFDAARSQMRESLAATNGLPALLGACEVNPHNPQKRGRSEQLQAAERAARIVVRILQSWHSVPRHAEPACKPSSELILSCSKTARLRFWWLAHVANGHCGGGIRPLTSRSCRHGSA